MHLYWLVAGMDHLESGRQTVRPTTDPPIQPTQKINGNGMIHGSSIAQRVVSLGHPESRPNDLGTGDTGIGSGNGAYTANMEQFHVIFTNKMNILDLC